MKIKQAEKAALEDLESLGYIRESVFNDGSAIVELWHHPCFPSDKDNGICKHEAVSGHWREVRK